MKLLLIAIAEIFDFNILNYNKVVLNYNYVEE
jgi:hypothetical protein